MRRSNRQGFKKRWQFVVQEWQLVAQGMRIKEKSKLEID